MPAQLLKDATFALRSPIISIDRLGGAMNDTCGNGFVGKVLKILRFCPDEPVIITEGERAGLTCAVSDDPQVCAERLQEAAQELKKRLGGK